MRFASSPKKPVSQHFFWGEYDWTAKLLQEKYIRRCRQCCRLSDSPCHLFAVPLLSHLHKRAVAASTLKTTYITSCITLLHLTLLHSLQIKILKWLHHTQPRSLHLGRGPEISPGRTALLLTTLGILTLPLTLLLLISATFTDLDLISKLWNIISPPLNFIFSSLLRHSCQWLLTAIPPTFSILIFNPKLTVTLMCVTTLLAFVPAILNLQNFLPSC